MAEDLDLPWPRCLGTFDEESCRYFLHEIGNRIVPNYPFSFGIEEAYGLILERYGVSGTPDVTSLLQELLEDEQNAAGLGDDGDVWRSWRHGWRHRNDDTRNPFIPRFGSFVLRPSTAPRVRLLKANNFTRQCEDNCTAVVEAEDQRTDNRCPSICDVLANAVSIRHSLQAEADLSLAVEPRNPISTCAKTDRFPWNRRLRTSGKVEEGQPVWHMRSSSATDPDPTLSTLFHMLEPGQRSSTQLRGGERSTNVLNEDKNGFQTGHRDSGTSFRAQSIAAINSQQRHMKREPHNQGDTMCCSSDEIPVAEASNRIETMPTSLHLTCPGSTSGRTYASDTVARTTASILSDEQQTTLTPEHKRRAVNREARLIDGTIFTSRDRRTNPVGQTSVGISYNPVADGRRYSAGQNRLSVKQRDSLRSNWTRDFRQLFHRDKQDKQSFSGNKRQSVPAPRKTNISRRHLSSMSIPRNQCPSQDAQDTAPQPTTGRFGLDGAADSPPTRGSPVNLNKPLPLSPDDIVRSMSSRSQLRSSHYSENASSLPSAISTISSLSRSSSKKEFRGTARDILQSEMLGPHELPPISEVEPNIQNVIDPQKPSALPASAGSYTSVAHGNPFSDKEPSRFPIRPPPLDFSRMNQACDTATSSPPMSRSQTTSDKSSTKPKQPENFFQSLPWSKAFSNDKQNDVQQDTRGRSRAALDSQTQIPKEDMPPKTPTKRSRSPIKKFLGLTKSNSTNMPETLGVPPEPTTPGSTKKDSLKKWGDRLRYGFLTPDQEQLRQEDLIEAHNNNSNTSTPQNSTFPVSLEPPLQAKIQSEIELILSVTANRYLMRESQAGRISADSVAKTRDLWERMNRPQVVEFHYDSITQHNLVMANLDRVRLYGDASCDAIAINSTLRGWKTMARELSIRTFCSPDSVIRKHLHDAHRVLELLGAPLVTFLAYEDMQLKTLTKINQRQKERVGRRAGSAGRNVSTSSSAMLGMHRRNASEGSYQQDRDYSDYPITALLMDKISLSPSPTPISGSKVRKATGAEGAIMSLSTNFERSRDAYAQNLRTVKMGQTVKEI